MSDQYKTKVRKLTEELRRLEQEKKDSMQVLNCREEELLARKDMLLWEKNNEKVQVRYSCLISCMILYLACCCLVLNYCFYVFWLRFFMVSCLFSFSF